MKVFVVLCLIVGALMGVVVTAEAADRFEWNRNTEVDVEHYEFYFCTTSSTCVPDPADSTAKLGANVPQPAVGVIPTMPFPPGKQGRAAVLAVDLVGNRSGLSNVVPFADSTPPSNPAGLVTK